MRDKKFRAERERFAWARRKAHDSGLCRVLPPPGHFLPLPVEAATRTNPTRAPCCLDLRRRRAISSGRCSGRENSAPPPLRRQQQKRTTGRSWRRCCSSASPLSSPRFTPSYTPSRNSRTPDLLVPLLFYWSHMILFRLAYLAVRGFGSRLC
jgi:hypothetical protein